MSVANPKAAARMRRKRSIRKRIVGTSERPRLSIFRSNKHMYAQVIDDSTGRTLAAASTLSPELSGKGEEDDKKSDLAKAVGKLIADKCRAQDISSVVFDRNGFIYHGRVRAVADGAREGGLEF
jgi:large subunit ribosomal protein L18